MTTTSDSTATSTSTTAPTTTTAAAPLTEIVDLHLAGYAEPDPARRRALLGAAWDPDGELFDPPLEASGLDGICELVDVVLSHFPDHTFRRTSAVDAHHGHARYSWSLVAADGTESVAGLDVVEISSEGKLRRVVGFFGPLPALES